MERDADKARDLEQEMHCAIWTSLARFEEQCTLKTWVYRVAHNVAADHVSNSSRGPKKVPLEDIETLPAADNPETDAADAHAMSQVATLIRQLPPLDAQVIVLWLEGESAASIAEVTDLSSGAISVRVHRIKTLFADHFTLPQTESVSP